MGRLDGRVDGATEQVLVGLAQPEHATMCDLTSTRKVAPSVRRDSIYGVGVAFKPCSVLGWCVLVPTSPRVSLLSDPLVLVLSFVSVGVCACVSVVLCLCPSPLALGFSYRLRVRE